MHAADEDGGMDVLLLIKPVKIGATRGLRGSTAFSLLARKTEQKVRQQP